jgi:hypothetical protein
MARATLPQSVVVVVEVALMVAVVVLVSAIAAHAGEPKPVCFSRLGIVAILVCDAIAAASIGFFAAAALAIGARADR